MAQAEVGVALSHLNHEIVASLEDFNDPSQEWRRLFSELLGTFFLVLVAAGGGMMGEAFPNTISRTAAVTATALMVLAILSFGLVSVILGTASGAQNIGIIGALGVGSYIALAGLWASPISGASMNPARTFGPDLASRTFTGYWVYIAGPIAGAALAVGIAFVLRGRGGDKSALGAAQGDLFTESYEPGKS